MTDLREKISEIVFNVMDDGFSSKDSDDIADEIMSLISQSESKETDSNEVKELEEIIKSYQQDIYNLDPEEMAKAILQAGYTKNKGDA